MSRPPRPWTRLASEIAAIVFGVLLALFLDDWREDRGQRAALDSVILSLRAELEQNQRVLEYRLPYHETLLDSIVDLSESARPSSQGQILQRLPGLDEMGFDQGVGLRGTLATGAWEAAQVSGTMTMVGVDELFLLSSAYTTQADLHRASNAMRLAYDEYLRAVVEGVSTRFAAALFRDHLSEVVEREAALCEVYRTLSTRLAGRASSSVTRCGSGHLTIS